MTSLESIKQDSPDGFNFIWSIHNFSYCTLKENGCIESPIFVIEPLGTTQWNIGLYPKGDFAPGCISCYLRKYNDSRCFNFAFYFHKSNEAFVKVFEGILNLKFGGCNEMLSHQELNEPGIYLENDTLTIRCKIWRKDLVLKSENCYAHTNMKVSKLGYLWNLKDVAVDDSGDKFNQTVSIPTFISGIPTLKLHVTNIKSLEQDGISLRIEMPEQKKDVNLVAKVQILDKEQQRFHSAHEHNLFFFESEKKIWDFPIISLRKLYTNKQIYIPSNEITLQCEFLFYGDPENISISYGKVDTTESNSAQAHLSLANGYELWRENLKQFFQEGKISDVVVRTSNQEFPAHRAILCAQSEVFLAMFENDMKEKETGIIEIEEIEDDTIEQMLAYLYTNTLDDIDNSAMQKLYCAADRYRIIALLRICSDHLNRNLDTSNICDVLALADRHQDQELKSCAQEFILANIQEVIDSEAWKNLIKNNLPLTSEIMQWILCRKFSKVK